MYSSVTICFLVRLWSYLSAGYGVSRKGMGHCALSLFLSVIKSVRNRLSELGVRGQSCTYGRVCFNWGTVQLSFECCVSTVCRNIAILATLACLVPSPILWVLSNQLHNTRLFTLRLTATGLVFFMAALVIANEHVLGTCSWQRVESSGARGSKL